MIEPNPTEATESTRNADYVAIHSCGLPMLLNPHPEAGKPDRMLEVGTVWQCIPCTQKALNGWSGRAMEAERNLQEVRDVIHGMWSMSYAREMDRRFGTVDPRTAARTHTGRTEAL